MSEKINKGPNNKKTSCIACGSNSHQSYGKQLLKCQKCGLGVAKSMPMPEELSRLYREEYFFGKEYFDYKADRHALEKNFHQRIKFLRPFLHSNAKVVEVGCAYGYFLNLIKSDITWHKGFDVSKEGIEYACAELDVNARSTDFLKDRDIKNSSVDLVCMWDVVEHLGEPDKYINKSAQILKRGGALSLTTGDMSSFVARKRGTKWRMIHPPTHIYYFSPISIQKLLAKNGLKVISVRYKSTYRNSGSVFNQLICNRKAKGQGAGLLGLGYKVAQLTKLDKLNIPLNLYDVMEVTAIKE